MSMSYVEIVGGVPVTRTVTPDQPLPVTTTSGGAAGATEATLQQVADSTAATAAAAADTTPVSVRGSTASDAPLADAPVPMGGRASSLNPTPVGDADVVALRLTTRGEIITVPHQNRTQVTQTAAPVSVLTSETDLIAAAGTGIFLDMLFIKLVNTTAAAINVDIRDAAAGTAVDTWRVPADSTAGIVYPAAFKQTTSNNKWTAQASATGVKIVAQWAQKG